MPRFDDDGSNPVYTFIDQTSSWSTLDPSLGVHRNADCVLLVFARQFASGTRKLRFHKHLRADFTLLERYQHEPGAPLSTPITGWYGTRDATLSRDRVAAWAEHTTAGFELVERDAGHFFHQDPQLIGDVIGRLQ